MTNPDVPKPRGPIKGKNKKMFKSWYRKKIHKQATLYYSVTKHNADLLTGMYVVNRLLLGNKLDPEEFYDCVIDNVPHKEKSGVLFDRHSELLRKAFIANCKKGETLEKFKAILDNANYEAELSVSLKST